MKGLGALGFTKKMGDPKMHGEFFGTQNVAEPEPKQRAFNIKITYQASIVASAIYFC